MRVDVFFAPQEVSAADVANRAVAVGGQQSAANTQPGAHPHTPRSDDLGVHPEREAVASLDPPSMTGEQVERPEILLARLRGERRHDAPRDLPADADRCLADAHETAVP